MCSLERYKHRSESGRSWVKEVVSLFKANSYLLSKSLAECCGLKCIKHFGTCGYWKTEKQWSNCSFGSGSTFFYNSLPPLCFSPYFLYLGWFALIKRSWFLFLSVLRFKTNLKSQGFRYHFFPEATCILFVKTLREYGSML